MSLLLKIWVHICLISIIVYLFSKIFIESLLNAFIEFLSIFAIICCYFLWCDKFQKILTAQKLKFSIKDFFSKCDQIHRFLRIWSHLLKKSLIENYIFWAVSQLLKKLKLLNKQKFETISAF